MLLKLYILHFQCAKCLDINSWPQIYLNVGNILIVNAAEVRNVDFWLASRIMDRLIGSYFRMPIGKEGSTQVNYMIILTLLCMNFFYKTISALGGRGHERFGHFRFQPGAIVQHHVFHHQRDNLPWVGHERNIMSLNNGDHRTYGLLGYREISGCAWNRGDSNGFVRVRGYDLVDVMDAKA